jgi:hypothetical protein
MLEMLALCNAAEGGSNTYDCHFSFHPYSLISCCRPLAYHIDQTVASCICGCNFSSSLVTACAGKTLTSNHLYLCSFCGLNTPYGTAVLSSLERAMTPGKAPHHHEPHQICHVYDLPTSSSHCLSLVCALLTFIKRSKVFVFVSYNSARGHTVAGLCDLRFMLSLLLSNKLRMSVSLETLYTSSEFSLCCGSCSTSL